MLSSSPTHGFGWFNRALAVLFCFILVAGVLPTSPAQAQSNRELTWILDGEPDILDPHVTTLAASSNINMRMFDNLIHLGTDNQFYPGMAEKWEYTRDFTKYTFWLRKDVKFHDGEPMNAAAWKFSFDRMLDPATKSLLAPSYIGPLDRFEIIDDYTFVLHYKEPYPILFNRAARPIMFVVSPKAVEKFGSQDFGRNPVGTGGFKFKEWVQNDRIVLDRNPDYKWPAPFFKNQGPPNFERIIFKYVAEPATRVGLLESGEANVVEGVDPQDIARLRTDSRVRIFEAVKNGTPWMYYVNNERTPTNDVKVRQAIAYAIDREGLNSTVFFNTTKPAKNLFAPNMWGFDPTVRGYDYDLNKAKQLLEESGWMLGSDGIRVKNGERLELIQIHVGDTRVDEFLQGNLREAGIDLKIQVMSVTSSTDASIAGNYHLARTWWVQNDPDVIRAWLVSENIPPNGTRANRVRYNNAQLDDWLKKAATLDRTDERKELYSKVAHHVIDNAVIIPIVEVMRFVATPSNFEEFGFDSNGYYVWMQDGYVK